MAEQQTPADGVAIWLLALGQTLGFAALYYSFAAFLPSWAADLGWSKGVLALGLTAAVLAAAVAAPLLGRLVDHGQGARLLVGGALWGGVMLALLSQVRTPGVFILLWALIGVAQAASLYDVCFAVLMRRLGPQARPAIIRVTLVAGFASTLAFPAGTGLAALLGWREALLIFAAVSIVVTAPINYLAMRRIRRGARPRLAPSHSDSRADVRAALRRVEFWLLAAIFALAWMNHGMIITYLLPVLAGIGLTPVAAVTVAALIGPAQVLGRLVLMLNESRVPSMKAALIALSGMVVSAAILLLAGAAPVLAFGFAAVQGASIGLMSILRPVLIAEVLGQASFGAIAGRLAMAPLLASAAAPSLGAALYGIGPLALVAALLVMSLLALGAFLALRARQGR